MPLESLKHLSHYLQKVVENRLWLKVIIAMVLGILFGIFILPASGIFKENTSVLIANWVVFPGILFIKLVQMVMIPLIITSVITGITSNAGNKNLGKTGVRLGIYFILTTVISVIIGMFVAYSLNPGKYFKAGQNQLLPEANGEPVNELPKLADLPEQILSVLPSNPLASILTGEMLSIVLFSIIIGVAITRLEDRNAGIINGLLLTVQDICMTIVRWAMKLAPYAVFGMMVQLVVNTGLSSIWGLAVFMLAVLIGLAIILVMYVLILIFMARYSPITFFSKIRDVQLLAFSMASTAAVIPLSIKTAEDSLHVKASVANLVIPVGATVNMNGTALFQCIGAIFLAQIYGLELSMTGIILLTFTLVAASIGTPSIPGGAIIVMAPILAGIGIPAEGIMILVGIDRIMGMFRTAVNVTGDLAACVLFDKWSTEEPSSADTVLTTS
jgi:Na+/H+-dicarboxylate symporter